jgi:hypothetical protein
MLAPTLRYSLPVFVLGHKHKFRIYGKDFGALGSDVDVALTSDSHTWTPNPASGKVIHALVVEVEATPSGGFGAGLGDLTITVTVTNPVSGAQTTSTPQSQDVLYQG